MPGDPSAGDVIQQANARIWEKRDEFEPGTNFKAWAMAIASYEVLNHRKRQARDARLVFSSELEETVASEMIQMGDDLAERQAALRECMKSLKPANRELLVLTLRIVRVAGRFCQPDGTLCRRCQSHASPIAILTCRLYRKAIAFVGRSQMTSQEQTTLMDALLDGEISEADFLRLEAELSIDVKVRRAYYRRLQLDLLLEQFSADESVDVPSQVPAIVQPAFRRGAWLAGILLTIAAALIGIITLSPWQLGRANKGTLVSETQVDEPSASGFAVLSGQSDAVWDGDPIGNGGLIPEGELHPLCRDSFTWNYLVAFNWWSRATPVFSIRFADASQHAKGPRRGLTFPNPHKGFASRRRAAKWSIWGPSSRSMSTRPFQCLCRRGRSGIASERGGCATSAGRRGTADDGRRNGRQ